jgi:hypothetical protein
VIPIRVAIAGVEQLRRSLKLTNERTKVGVRGAIRRGTVKVRDGAKARVHQRTGELHDTIRDEYSGDEMVGWVKVGYGKLPRRSRAKTDKGQARAKRRGKRPTGKGAYGPVEERGDKRRNRPAHPFLHPSLRDEKSGIISDVEKSLEGAVE